ncbi:heavy-metal-associated domain-containing protein [Amycolatopsis pigmentata]|uniref:Heavy-metal-associated domain-containing protein n=1 Tax=Amycolatopsis pigmentata TaxID=450801 RepID=A0ABW5FIS9_9PSEU
MKSTYTVNGMSCGHCASSLTEEVSKLDGVRTVDVDVENKRVTITSETPLPFELITNAVTEAGYELVN